MYKKNILIIAIIYLLAACDNQSNTSSVWSYPDSPTIEQVDDYHGTSVKDPFRWLETDNEKTQQWVKTQQTFTNNYLQKLEHREKISSTLKNSWNFATYNKPILANGRYLYFKNDGLQNQPSLYIQDNVEQQPKLLIDPNTLSEDGTKALQNNVQISPNGKYLAYGVSESGSDWTVWQVLEISTGKILSDKIEWVKFIDITWDKTSEGFYYGRYAAPEDGQALQQANYFHKLYYHKLGDEQENDKLIYERADQKEWIFEPSVSDDGRFLLIRAVRGTSTRHRYFYLDLNDPKAVVQDLLTKGDGSYQFLGNKDNQLFFFTNKQAPLGKVISVDTANNNQEKVIITERKEEALQEGDVINNSLVLKYLRDAVSVIQIYSLAGEPIREVKLPGLGRVQEFNGSITDTQSVFVFDSYIQVPTVYLYDFINDKSEALFSPKTQFNVNDYQSEQIFYKSKDGTRIPMILSYKKGLKKNGDTPTKLFGYGGFTVNLTPRFNPVSLAWMDLGGIHAVANLRGGNEYGEQWHQAGMLSRKQNVFDDFIAAAEWLINNRYTNKSKLAIEGRSNGGLLVGATVNQRPDLFAAAIPHVGVMDMLRFHKFTIGWAWVPEYGSAENAAQFDYLYAYSPLHNIQNDVDYPAILVTTADHDDRVVPAHSFKYAAALQKASTGDAPKLIRIENKAGHGAGKPVSKRIEEFTDVIAFLAKHLDMKI